MALGPYASFIVTSYTLVAAVVVILIVFVQLVQSLGDWLVRRLSHK